MTTTRQVTQEQIERIRELADHADSFQIQADQPTTRIFDRMKFMFQSIGNLRDDLRQTYIAMSGTNPWGEA